MKSSNILTLTLNPAIDHIFSVDRLAFYSKNIINQSRIFYGGKGINVANALGKLNSPCVASGFIGKKEQAAFKQKLAAVGVETAMVCIDGPSRVNIKIMDDSQGKDTELNQKGFSVSADDLAKLTAQIVHLFEHTSWLAISGSLPPGAPVNSYYDLIHLAQAQGVKTCLDTSGEALKAGLRAQPTLLRINRSELEEISGCRLDSPKQIKQAIQDVLANGVVMAIISLGGQGILGSDGTQSLLARIPAVEVQSLTGAGDTLTAGCLHMLSQGKPFEEVLRFGSALATASTLSLEPGDFTQENLEAVLAQTSLTTV